MAAELQSFDEEELERHRLALEKDLRQIKVYVLSRRYEKTHAPYCPFRPKNIKTCC